MIVLGLSPFFTIFQSHQGKCVKAPKSTFHHMCYAQKQRAIFQLFKKHFGLSATITRPPQYRVVSCGLPSPLHIRYDAAKCCFLITSGVIDNIVIELASANHSGFAARCQVRLHRLRDTLPVPVLCQPRTFILYSSASTCFDQRRCPFPHSQQVAVELRTSSDPVWTLHSISDAREVWRIKDSPAPRAHAQTPSVSTP